MRSIFLLPLSLVILSCAPAPKPTAPSSVVLDNDSFKTTPPTPIATPSVTPSTAPANEIEVPIRINGNTNPPKVTFDMRQAKTLRTVGQILDEDLTQYCGSQSNLGKPVIKSAKIEENRLKCDVGMAFYGETSEKALLWAEKSAKKAKLPGTFGTPVGPDKGNSNWMVYFKAEPFTRHMDGLCSSLYGKDYPNGRIIYVDDKTCRQVTNQQ